MLLVCPGEHMVPSAPRRMRNAFQKRKMSPADVTRTLGHAPQSAQEPHPQSRCASHRPRLVGEKPRTRGTPVILPSIHASRVRAGCYGYGRTGAFGRVGGGGGQELGCRGCQRNGFFREGGRSVPRSSAAPQSRPAAGALEICMELTR